MIAAFQLTSIHCYDTDVCDLDHMTISAPFPSNLKQASTCQGQILTLSSSQWLEVR